MPVLSDVRTPGLLAGPAPVPAATRYPESFPLPDGFRAQGIAVRDGLGYFGGRADGAIYRVGLSTGQGAQVGTAPGLPALGLTIDRYGRLFVAGGDSGSGRVVDSRTGAVLANYPLAADATTLVSDVVVTDDAAYFTEALKPVLYKVPLGRRGELPSREDVVTIPLTGEMVHGDAINSSGITTTAGGAALLVLQVNSGTLFTVEPATGVTRAVDLGGYVLADGGGLLRIGHMLYVVQNRSNRVAVFRLDRANSAGRLLRTISDPRFDAPSNVVAFHGRLYVPNTHLDLACDVVAVEP